MSMDTSDIGGLSVADMLLLVERLWDELRAHRRITADDRRQRQPC